MKSALVLLFSSLSIFAKADVVGFECTTSVSINQLQRCPLDKDGFETMCGSQSRDIPQGNMTVSLALDDTAESCSGTLTFQGKVITLDCSTFEKRVPSTLDNQVIAAKVKLAQPLYGGRVSEMQLSANKWISADGRSLLRPSTQIDFIDVSFGQLMPQGQLSGGVRFGQSADSEDWTCRAR